MTPVYTSGLPGAATFLWHLALLTLAGWVLGFLIWKKGTRGNPLLIVRALRGGIRNYSSAGSLTFEGWNALNTLRKKKNQEHIGDAGIWFQPFLTPSSKSWLSFLQVHGMLLYPPNNSLRAKMNLNQVSDTCDHWSTGLLSFSKTFFTWIMVC